MTAREQTRPLALYPRTDRASSERAAASMAWQVRLAEFVLRGVLGSGARAGWDASLWDQLKLAEFWRDRLPGFAQRALAGASRVLQTLTVYRLPDPGSEVAAARRWFPQNKARWLICWTRILAGGEGQPVSVFWYKLLPHRTALSSICDGAGR